VFAEPLHSNGSYSIVACVFVAAGKCLPSICLAIDVSSDYTIPAFWHHFNTIFGFLDVIIFLFFQVENRAMDAKKSQ
jgi:hypothetical protein